jgi:hypothetical protein
LSRWLEQQGLTLAQVTPSTLQRFEKDRWKRGGTKRKNSLVPLERNPGAGGQPVDLAQVGPPMLSGDYPWAPSRRPPCSALQGSSSWSA